MRGPYNAHHFINCIFLITESCLVNLAAKGLNTVTFGNVNVNIYRSLDDVFDAIHNAAADE
jgi:hypothetical protein